MTRIRERSSGAPSSPVLCGSQSYDFTYPYGDGPWTSQSDLTVAVPSTPGSDEKCVDSLNPGPPYRTGGGFTLFRKTTDQFLPKGGGTFIDSFYRYDISGFLPTFMPASWHSYSFSDAVASNWGDPSSYGATGWKRFQPVRSAAGLGQFVAEFRDIPRTLRQTALSFRKAFSTFSRKRKGGGWSKQAANEWVNTQFGWAPFIRDLRDFYEVTTTLEKRVAQLKRDNGQWVKRGGTVDIDSGVEILKEGATQALLPVLNSRFYETPSGSYSITKTWSWNCWFEGRFRYWIPDLESSPWDARSKAIIFGAMPSPELVWELIPWSWLIDWVSNAGDVIANLSNSLLYGLTAKYAYIMGTKRETITSSTTANFKQGSQTLIWTSDLVAKHRVGASPFGFGLSSGDFSAWQWSILGALGLSRLKLS